MHLLKSFAEKDLLLCNSEVFVFTTVRRFVCASFACLYVFIVKQFGIGVLCTKAKRRIRENFFIFLPFHNVDRFVDFLQLRSTALTVFIRFRKELN